MYIRQSTEEASDIQLLQELNNYLQKPDTSSISLNSLSRRHLGQLNNLMNSHNPQSEDLKTTPLFFKTRQQIIEDMDNTTQQQSIVKWQHNLNRFYELFHKLIILDQQIVYLKNILNRYGESKKCQCPHLQTQLVRFSIWEYLPNLSPLPSEEEVGVSERKLVRCFEEGNRMWEGMVKMFSREDAEIIFQDLDWEKKGVVDVFDVVGRLEDRKREVYDVKDVINVFRRFTKKDQLTRKEFVLLFSK